jgi:Tol biopolymer transport system component
MAVSCASGSSEKGGSNGGAVQSAGGKPTQPSSSPRERALLPTPSSSGTYQVNLSSHEVTPVTGVRGADWADVSSRGRRVAFNGRDGMYVMNIDGSDLHLLRTGRLSALRPDWSPDGRKLAFDTTHVGTVALAEARAR